MAQEKTNSGNETARRDKFSSVFFGDRSLETKIFSMMPVHDDVEKIQRIHSARGADRYLADEMPELVILDLDAKHIKPFKILSTLLKSSENKSIMAVAVNPEIDSIVKCMRMGVSEFLQLPQESHKLRESINRIFTKWQNKQKSHEFNDRQYHRFDLNNIIAGSAGMQKVVEISRKIMRRPWVTVLVRGETGTGKEVIARGIHYGTEQTKNKAFVEVNCTAIPESLLESELFGYEKGAFTDAKFAKKGLLEVAEGGTLFLDEIGDMSLLLQAKLLKAIEEKRFRRLGGISDIQVKTRIIAGTNADLKKKMEMGEFRNDLYYRLNVINIVLPNLNERGQDILLLANFFLDKFSSTYNIPKRRFSEGAKEILLHYDWPGNVRELQHVIERVVVLEEEPIIEADEINSALGLDKKVAGKKEMNGASWQRVIEIPREGLSLKDGEMQLISEVLKLSKGNKTQASKILGISRPRLNRKIDEYQISLQ